MNRRTSNGTQGTLLRPDYFPIGSPESRAAARVLAVNRQDTRARIEFVTNARIPWFGERSDPDSENSANWNPEEPHIGPWRDHGDTLMRFVYVPSETSPTEVRKIADRLK